MITGAGDSFRSSVTCRQASVGSVVARGLRVSHDLASFRAHLHVRPIGVADENGFTLGGNLLYPLGWNDNRDTRPSSSPYDVSKRDRYT
jgi:hypothetical protein